MIVRGGTSAVREELIGVRATKACDQRAETAGLLRAAGRLQLHAGGVVGIEATHEHPGVARRIHEAIAASLGHPDRTVMEQPGQGHPKPRYVVHIERASAHRLIEAGLLDEAGHPSNVINPDIVAKQCCVAAFLRGAFLARGSVHAPRSGPHLEIRADDEPHAEELVELMARIDAKARARIHRTAAAVVKDDRSVITVLTAMGAHTAALAREDAGIWKGIHSDANRLRNADAANAGRQGRAAATQLAAIAELSDRVGLSALPKALREAAELRVQHPDETLEELSELAGISRSAMADRLRRIVSGAAEQGPNRPRTA